MDRLAIVDICQSVLDQEGCVMIGKNNSQTYQQ